MKKLLLLLLLIPLLLISPLARDSAPFPDEGVKLYFLEDMSSDLHHGPALAAEPYLAMSSSPNSSTGPFLLMKALLAGPTQKELRSPFPKGVTLENWRWDPEKPGCLQIRLSEQYSGLTDISLTLADYCIVLTLSQIPELQSVVITSSGYTSGYQGRRALQASEVLLTEPLDIPADSP